MELLGLGLLLLFALAIIILWTRGVFARDLTQALKRVTQQEQALQEKADMLERGLTQMEREYQGKLKRADQETERALQEAKQQAANIRTVAMEEAKHRVRRMLLEAEQGKVQLRAEVEKELNGHAMRQACESLRTLLPAAQLAALHTSLMDELLAALTTIDVRPFRDAVQQLEINTANALTAAESDRMRQWAAQVFGAHVPLQAHVDTTLVAGGVVQIGPTIVDNSLWNRLSRNHLGQR